MHHFLLYLCIVIALTGAATADTCTLTGPTIIDFQSHLNNVTDRCVYSLVSNSDSGFEVFAEFLERRRKDVPFVDSVTLSYSGNTFVLQQGGGVQVNGEVKNINSTSQTISGVEIFKDESGVTAGFSTSDNTISVFFDGTTAQIFMEVPENSTLGGLCVDASDVPSERLLGKSHPSCEEPHTETLDSSVDCVAMTKRCNILRKHSFASCNADVDPTPYIDACRETMSRYPSEDGLMTQFLWAYARACSLNGHNELGDWWTKAECAPPKAYCQGTFCKDHEFCGWKFSGQPACLCRAVFAWKYKESDTLGEPTVCKHNTASVTLAKCLMEERGIDYKVLHLNDPTCKGKLDNKTNMVTFSFNSKNLCGAEILSDKNEINYTNAIMNQKSNDAITRHDQVFIEFSCYRPQPELKSVCFRIKDNSYVGNGSSGEWDYTVYMTPYIDEKCSKVVATETEVKLNQKVWVELKTHGLPDDTIAVVTDSCWATSDPNPGSTQRYDLIIDGCPNHEDGTVHATGNGIGTSNRFSFNMFEFSKHPDKVYLHCQLELCLTKKHNCLPVCSTHKRRRRFARSRYSKGESAYISMGWRK